jgi:hypothetical protein
MLLKKMVHLHQVARSPSPAALQQQVPMFSITLGGLRGDGLRVHLARVGIQGDLPAEEEEAAGLDGGRVRCEGLGGVGGEDGLLHVRSGVGKCGNESM